MRRLAAAAALLLLAAAPAPAQDEGEDRAGKGTVQSLTGETRNLVHKVENLAGKVADLKLKESKTEIRIELAADVLFDFDKADLRKEAQDTLKKAAAAIREHAKGNAVTIEGHTDGKGKDDYNQRLSERRAQAVRDWFVKQGGLGSMKFSTRGFGKTKPVAPNAKPDGADDPEGRQKNRRVEIVMRKA